jgi:hypothetical protein
MSHSRCARNGRCAKRNWIHFKISLQYDDPKLCESCSIHLASPSLKSSLQRSFRMASADWKDSVLMFSSLDLRCGSVQVLVC